MNIRLKVPSWTPCKFEPEIFDCRNCEIGWSNCRLKSDHPLRHERSTRARRSADLLSLYEEYDGIVESQIARFLERHGMGVSSSVLYEYIHPGLPSYLSEQDVLSVLKKSRRFKEASPGVFTLTTDTCDSLDDFHPLPVSTGVQLELLLRESQTLSRNEQLALFKRLAGARYLIAVSVKGMNTDDISETVGHMSGWARIHRGWNEFDLYKYAVGSTTVPPVDQCHSNTKKEEWVANTHTLLSAVAALAWTNGGTSGSSQVEYRHLLDLLITANLRLVATNARSRTLGNSMTYADLFQEGTLGLMDAIERYDPFRGYVFSTYATHWIRQRIGRALGNYVRVVRLPIHVEERIQQIKRATIRLYDKNEREPAFNEIAQESKLSSDEVQTALKHDFPIESLELLLETQPETVEDRLLLDFTEYPEFDEVVVSETIIREGLDSLRARDAQVLRLRFGMEDGHEHTLEEVGQILKVTRERVRQIEKKALERLQRHFTTPQRNRIARSSW